MLTEITFRKKNCDPFSRRFLNSFIFSLKYDILSRQTIFISAILHGTNKIKYNKSLKYSVQEV